jgi:hypothetical protein
MLHEKFSPLLLKFSVNAQFVSSGAPCRTTGSKPSLAEYEYAVGKRMYSCMCDMTVTFEAPHSSVG